ncbi:channel protein TolC [Enterobacteriaceae bacterium RIT702]|jgi:adhesin transport system outer membrane protein|nr:channel protein TolC [Enterobacteriaceae bacterium RIT702]
MKKINTSLRLLPLLVGALMAMESGGLYANDDDELLMFVDLSKQQKSAPVAPVRTSNSVSADAMAKMLVQQTQTQKRAPAVQVSKPPVAKPVVVASKPVLSMPAPSTLPAAPLLANPVVTVSTPPAKPLLEQAQEAITTPQVESAPPVKLLASSTIETQAPAPIRQAAEPSRVVPSESLSISAKSELPVFRPAPSSEPVASSLPGVGQPQLTPEPALSVAKAPVTVQRASPGELELRGIFYRAVMTALERSPQLRSTQLQVEAAKEDVSNAKGQRWPQVDVTSNSRRYEFGKGNRNASDSNMPAFGVNVATNLIDFGQTSNTIKSKEFSVKAADFQNTAQAEDLAWQVSNGLVELSKQRLIIEMSKQYVARMQELVKMLSGIVEADQGRRSELTQATGRYLQAQSALDNAVAKARDTEIQLYRLLGESQVPLPPSMQWQLQPALLDALLAQVDKHPTLAQARAQSLAASSEADALKSSSLPKINWVVSKDTGKDYYGREQAWQTGINVSWGLFRGGSASAAERAAVQRAAAMREQADNQRDDLQQRVRAADQDARSMLQRADLYRNLTRESDRIRLDFFDQWYHLGKRTLLDVLSAESDYYNNRVGEVTNRFDGYSAIFRGYASAGQLMNWLKNNPQPR